MILKEKTITSETNLEGKKIKASVENVELENGQKAYVNLLTIRVV